MTWARFWAWYWAKKNVNWIAPRPGLLWGFWGSSFSLCLSLIQTFSSFSSAFHTKLLLRLIPPSHYGNVHLSATNEHRTLSYWALGLGGVNCARSVVYHGIICLVKSSLLYQRDLESYASPFAMSLEGQRPAYQTFLVPHSRSKLT